MFDPLQDAISELNVQEVFGSDLTIINAARVSYGNQSTEMGPSEIKLLKYLWDSRHGSPFYHPKLRLYIKCPLFCAREWYKHVIGSGYSDNDFAWNEISMRYIDQTKEKHSPQFYVPSEWRLQSNTNKQSSSSTPLNSNDSDYLTNKLERLCTEAVRLYTVCVEAGGSKEQARLFLPVNIYTSFIWTTSLYALIHFIKLRNTPEAQWEIRQYAAAATEVLHLHFPHTASLLP